MLYYLLSLPVLLVTCFALRRLAFDRASSLLIMGALALSYIHLYSTGWNDFSIDAPSHAEYITYIINHHALPTALDTSAGAHPPTYYILSTGLYSAAVYTGASDPLLAVRHISMACFAAFLIISARLLRHFLSGTPYIAALALLAFWPIGITMGARITCDILLYAGEIGTLYYLARWIKSMSRQDVSGMFLWSAVSVLAKNGGVVMLAAAAMVLLIMMVIHRRALRTLFTRDLVLSIVFAALSCFLTLSHGWIMSRGVASGAYNLELWWQRISSFDPFLFLYDTNMGLSHDKFWNMFFHTLLLGDVMHWKAESILMTFNVIWSVLILYILTGMFHFRMLPAADKCVLAALGALMGVMLAGMLYMLLRTGNPAYCDGRYIYPLVSVIALCHGKVIECHRAAGRMDAGRIGVALSASFVVLTLMLFAAQHIL